jgi:hypothetical protein
MIRNEADIVESFVRHNLKLLDGLTVIVHRPSDGTREILEALGKEGLPLELMPLDELGFYQGQRMSQAARSVFARHRPDFVFALDADEFLRAPSRAELRVVLGALPPDRHGITACYTFAPDPRDDASEPEPVKRLRHRHPNDTSSGRFRKLIINKSFADDASLVICHGNHALASTDPVKDKALATQLKVTQPLLSHYPVRSGDQVLIKTLIGWLAHIVIGEHQIERSAHWRAFYERIKARASLSEEELAEIALDYLKDCVAADQDREALRRTVLIEDPLPVDFAIRYGDLRQREPLACVVNYSEQLALAYLELQRRPAPRGFS